MYELNVKKIRCGGVYCTECKKCICQPRVKKYLEKESWITCEECGKDVLRFSFRPREEALLTDFKIKYQDLPGLIKELQSLILPKTQ